MLSKEFYVEYGKVLYALAMADGAVQEKERQALVKLIQKELVPLEDGTDEFGSQLAYYTEFAFEAQDELRKSTKNAIDNFFEAINKQSIIVPDKVKKVCVAILEKVADAHAGIDEEELLLIEDFKERLYEL